MKVGVWDTFVTKKDGSTMHFDIIVPEGVAESNLIHQYGRSYLRSKGQAGQPITSKECTFCHFQNSLAMWDDEIAKQGYYIYEMENCT